MSRSIDERAVIMEFDNDQFEKGIAQSRKSLEEFEKKLQLEGASKAINNINKQFKNIDFSLIQNSLESIANRFSGFGIAGMTVIQNLTNAVVDFTKGALTNLYNKINTAGKNRAINIEKSRFLLQGILKDEEQVLDAMDRADRSVTGTAYAYDSAARAAATFVASGARGEKLSKYLNVVADLTATVSGNYDEISNIIQKVVGSHKLYTRELQQITHQGFTLDVYIADYFNAVNKGLDNVPKKVKQNMKAIGLLGKKAIDANDLKDSDKLVNIYSETVMEAIEYSIGGMAKRANETFTGAIENIGAAWARIGALFWEPLVKQNSDLVTFINVLRVSINAVKEGLRPFADMVTKIILSISKAGHVFGIFEETEKGEQQLIGTSLHLTKLFEAMGKVVTPLMEIFHNLVTATSALFGNEVVDRINHAIDAFSLWVDKGTDGFQVGYNLYKRISDLAKAFDAAMEPVRDFWSMVRAAFYAVFDLKEGTDAATGFLGVLTDLFNKISDSYNKSGFRNSIFDSMVSIFTSLKSIGGSLMKIISAIGGAFSDVFIVDGANSTQGFFEFLASILEKIADLITIDDKAFDGLKTTFTNLFTTGKLLFGVFGQILKVAVEALPQLMPFISILLEAVSGVIQWMSSNIDAKSAAEGFKKVLIFLGTAIQNIIGFVGGAIQKFKEWLEPIKAAVKESGILESIMGLLSTVFEKIKGKMEEASTGIQNFLGNTDDQDSKLEKFSNWLQKVKEWIDKLTKALKNFKMGEGFKGFIDFIKELFSGGSESGDSGKGGAAALGKGQMMKVGAQLKPIGDAKKALDSIGGSDTIKNVSETLKKYLIPFLSVVARVIATIVGLKLAKSIFSYISFISNLPKELIDGAKAWADVPKAFIKTMKSGMTKKFIIALVASIALLIGAITVLIKTISEIPADRFGPTMTAFGIIFGVVVVGIIALLVYMSKMEKAMASSSAGSQGKGLILAKQMMAIAAVLSAIGVAMLLMALTFKILATTFMTIKDPSLISGVGFIMVSALIVLVALAVFLEEHAREMTASAYKPLMAIALVIGAVAGSMMLIAKAFVMMAIVVAKLPIEATIAVGIIFEAILLTLALIIGILGGIAPRLTNAGPAIMGMAAVMAAIALVMIGFAKSVQILVATLAELVALILLTFGKDPGAFILAMETLGIIAGSLAGGVLIFVGVLGLLNKFGASVDWKSLLGIAVVMFSFAVALKMVVGTFIEMAAMVSLLDQANVEQAMWLFLGLMGGMALVIGLLTVLAGIAGPTGIALFALGAAFVSFGASMFLIASAFAVFITAISEFIILLETLSTLNPDGIAAGMKNFFDSFAKGIEESMPAIKSGISKLFTGDKSVASLIINGILTSIENNVNKIATTFGKVVDVMYDAIVKKEKKIDKIKEKITGFLQDILDNIGGLGIADLISKFLFGEESDFDVKAAGLLGTLEEIFLQISIFLPQVLFDTIAKLLELIGENIETIKQFLIDRALDAIDVLCTVIERSTDRIVGTVFFVLGALIHGLSDFLTTHQEDILTILGAPFTWIAELLIRHKEDILTALAAPIEWLGELLIREHETIMGVLGGVTVILLEWLGILFTELRNWWDQNWPTVSEFLYATFMDTLELAAKALIDSTELITKTAVELGFSVIIGFLDGIAEKLPEVAESAINLVETIRDEVVTEENVQRMMDAGAGIIINFLNGMSEWLENESNIRAIQYSIARFGRAIINAIKTFFGFDDSGNTTTGGELWKTTGNFLQGFANGIQRAWENNPVKKAIDFFTNKVKEATNKGMEEQSPSKFTERVGKFFLQGFANGVSDNTKIATGAIDDSTGDIKSAFSTMMEALKIVGNDEFDINPTITPVVDTSNIESAAKMANGMFGTVNGGFLTSYGAASALAADFAQNGGVGPGSDLAGNSSVVNFTQNNYSPEALSHYEVYRQTKNLLHTIDSRT